MEIDQSVTTVPDSSREESARPIRVLHVLGSLVRGGIETWLMNVLRHMDRKRFTIDIVVSSHSPSPLLAEAEKLGSKIHVCMAHSEPLRLCYNLAGVLRTEEPYDIIHSNLHHLSGLICLTGRLHGIPVRIAHSHIQVSGAQGEVAGLRYRLARWFLQLSANGALACSQAAGRELFGPQWEERFQGKVLYYGIDLAHFRNKPDPLAVRSSLGIPSDAVVIGHAGRFAAQKNHVFFLKVAEAHARLDPHAHYLLVGDGPLWAEIKQRADASPFAERFHFPGVRYDIPELMMGAMDCFLFPSLFEGTPVALLEAQAAGLPCVLSDVISTEGEVYPELFYRVALEQGPEKWARIVERALSERMPDMRAAAFNAIEASAFNFIRSLENLEKYYFLRCSAARSPRHL
jgi:glycosyltransferase involved in cell wall biosynthesis